MCFSVSVNLVKEEIEQRYGVDFPDKYRYEPSYYYHAFGMPELPAICSGSPGLVSILKWGLVPGWTRSPEEADEIRIKTFNARSDSLAEKPSFRDSFRNRRCLIPVSGFFEWQHRGRQKVPWYIYPAGEKFLTLGGLYSEWTNPVDGSTVNTFTIVTTDANKMMAEIHNSKKRMPLILGDQAQEAWLDISLQPADIKNIITPAKEDELAAHTISPAVGSRTVEKNSADIIKPYTWHTDNLLF